MREFEDDFVANSEKDRDSAHVIGGSVRGVSQTTRRWTTGPRWCWGHPMVKPTSHL